MQFFLFILLFGLSIGLSVIGVLTSYRLKSASPDDSFASLFYFQTLSFIYGFYGIWGSIGSKLILNNLPQSENILENLVMLFPFLAVPFLIVAWYLQLKFTFELKSIKTKNLFPILFFSIFSVVFLAIGIIFKYFMAGTIDITPADISKTILLLNFLISSFSGIILMIFVQKSVLPIKINYLLSSVFTVGSLFILISYLCLQFHYLSGFLFVLLYFMFPALISVITYMNYKPEPTIHQTFNNLVDFCKEFGISNRESDIIREICDGKSNREIAEKLFITLQTVKDHSHRIYSKTGVSSRVQLAKLVNERIKPGPTPV